jgi:hypothetical protein
MNWKNKIGELLARQPYRLAQSMMKPQIKGWPFAYNATKETRKRTVANMQVLPGRKNKHR